MQEDPKFLKGKSLRSAEARLRHFLGLCGSKRIDEATGGAQPHYKLDGMSIQAEFKKPKEDDDIDLGDNIERKQVRRLNAILSTTSPSNS